MVPEDERSAVVKKEIGFGLEWSKRFRRRWSVITHVSAWSIIIFSIIAAALANIDKSFLTLPLTAWASIFSGIAAILAGIQLKVGFDRKWASFRLTHTELRFLMMDIEMGMSAADAKHRLEEIYRSHDQAVLGGVPTAKAGAR